MTKTRSLSSCCLVLLIAAPALSQSAGSRAAATADLRLVTAVKEKNKEAARSLLGQRVGVNATQPDGATALHWAARWDDVETADLLIRAGATVNATNVYGVSALSLACTNANAAMVEKLLAAGADPNAALPTGETVLMTCARAGNAAAVKALLARGADVKATLTENGQTALMWAAAQNHAEVVQALVAAGADVNGRSKSGFTPLLFAARAGHVDSTRALLAAGADVNERTPVRPNPTRKPDEEALRQTAAPGEAERLGTTTPLLMAAASGHEPLAIFLLDQGADPNAVDGRNRSTALHYAVMRGISLINGLQYFKDTIHFFRPNMPGLVKALLAHGANPNVRHGKNVGMPAGSGADSIGATPFLAAAATGDVEIMRLLLASKADPRLEAAGGFTPLMAAAGLLRDLTFTEAEERAALEAVKLVLELGTDVNAANAEGWTALHAAAIMGSDPIVQILADHGAKLDVKDKFQQTPLSIASGLQLHWVPKSNLLGEVKHKSTEELLLTLGATPLSAPGYFTEVEDSEVVRINPSSMAKPGAN